MKSKSFITTVDKSLLTPTERKLKKVFKENPKLTLEQAMKALEQGVKPEIEEPVKEVEIPKVAKPASKAKPKAKKK